jgi:hypothetical protein
MSAPAITKELTSLNRHLTPVQIEVTQVTPWKMLRHQTRVSQVTGLKLLPKLRTLKFKTFVGWFLK